MKIGFLIIGNEILSGRTAEKNLPMLARILAEKGLQISESRIVGDSPPIIAAALNDMRQQCDAVFTSGGIGPTHDDVTIDGVAAAFAVSVIYHPDADALLADFYARQNLPYTAARRRMARARRGRIFCKVGLMVRQGLLLIMFLFAPACQRFLP